MDAWKKRRIVGWLVAVGVAVLVFCLVFFLRKIYTITGVCDALFCAASIDIAILLFVWIERSGAFDVFNFQFYRFFESFRPDGIKRWDTAYEYKIEKEEKRRRSGPYYWPYLIISSIFLVAAIVLLVIIEVTVASHS